MLASNAPCKCGASKKSFKFIPYKDIAHQWECPKCEESLGKAEPKKEEAKAEAKAADVNKDGKVDEKDLSIVHKEYSAEKKVAKKKASKKKATKKKAAKKDEKKEE